MGNTISAASSEHIFLEYVKSGDTKGLFGLFTDKTPPETYFSCQDENGNSPLHLCVLYNHPHILELLISMGFEIKSNNDGDTPLHLAARMLDVSSIEKVFGSHSSYTTSRITKTDIKTHSNHNGQTPYDIVPQTDDPRVDICKNLLKYERQHNILPGIKNKILNGICRISVARNSVYVSLVSGVGLSIIFLSEQSKKDRERDIRYFLIEIETGGSKPILSVSGPSLPPTLYMDFNNESDAILSHKIEKTCKIDDISIEKLILIAKICASSAYKNNFFFSSSGFYDLLYLCIATLKKVTNHSETDNLLNIILSHQKNIVNIKPSTVSFSPRGTFYSSRSGSGSPRAPAQPLEITKYFLNEINFFDHTQKIGGRSLTSTSTKRDSMYVCVCSQKHFCDWMADSIISIIYTSTNASLRVFSLSFKLNSKRKPDITLKGPVEEENILSNYEIIENAVLVQNISLDDLVLCANLALLLSDTSFIRLQNFGRLCSYTVFELIVDVFTTGISKLETKNLASQLEIASGVVMTERIVPSTISRG